MSFLSRLQDVDFFLSRVSEKKSRSRVRLKRVYAFNLSRDLDFSDTRFRKKSTPVGGEENDTISESSEIQVFISIVEVLFM